MGVASQNLREHENIRTELFRILHYSVSGNISSETLRNTSHEGSSSSRARSLNDVGILSLREEIQEGQTEEHQQTLHSDFM